MGFGELGCYGHPQFKTPQIDRMAAEGARLTNFNAPMPFCAPTRASLLTGRYPFRCRMTSNPSPDGGPDADALALPATEVTLAQWFHQAGYATGMVGKWHLGHKLPEYLPTHRGFDEYLGIPYSNDMRPVKLLDGDRTVEYPVVQCTLTRRYTERALSFLDRNKDRPFFFYFAHAMPHKPLAPSEAYYRTSGAGLYGDVLAELDWSVGQVLAKLKQLGLDERTLVLFTSDNGPWYGGSTGGLRGMKGSSFEGGYRVPMIARWPGRIPAGRVNGSPAVMMDLFDTALAAAGISPPKDRVIDGKNIMPLFTSDSPSPHEVIFGHAGPRLATVRDARWKLHVLAPGGRKPVSPEEKWIDPRAPDGVTILAPYEQYQPSQYPGVLTGDPPKPGMLFDLEHDPAEQHDVAADHPEVVSRLRKAFDEMNKDVPPPPVRRKNEVLGFDASKVRPSDSSKGVAIARVFYDYIYPADVGAASPKLSEAEAERLTGRIFGELRQRYMDRYKITATPEEIRQFVAAIDHSPADQDSSKQKDGEQRGLEAIGEQMVKGWKLDRSLYKKYGGIVIFQQANPFEPVGAYRKFLETMEEAKVFEIYDPENRKQFWHYFVRQHPFQVPQKEIDFDKPWWMRMK